jgi:hypothetical protein
MSRGARATIDLKLSRVGIVGLVADLLSVNRKLLEDIQLRMRRFELDRRGGLTTHLDNSVSLGLAFT